MYIAAMAQSFKDHPLVEKLHKLKRSSRQISDVIKLLKYADDSGVIVTLEADPDDEKNPGVYDFSNKKITIDPKYVKWTDKTIFVLLHELGHVIQLSDPNAEHTLTARYPVAMKAEGYFCEFAELTYMRSQKYWIDTMGFELEAWGLARTLADELKIEIDDVEWTKLRHSCMRKLVSWFKD